MTEQETALPPAGPNSPDNGSPDNDAPETASPNQSSRPSVEERAADCIDGLSSRLGTLDLARGLVDWQVSRNAQRRVIGHYVAAAHGMMMDLCAEARGFLGRAQPASLDDQAHKRAMTAARLASTGARFMERIRLGVQSLNGLAPDGDGSNGGGPDGGERNVIYHMIEGTDDLVRQYEFDLAKVLAAGGCCRQPAMANGRCRLHGELSTGPRTAQGLARSIAARLSHGCSSAKVIDLRRAAAALGRRFDRTLAAVQATNPAGHGVDRADWTLSLAPVVGAPPCGRPVAGEPGRAFGPTPTLRSSSVLNPTSAGHGVDRAFFGRAVGRLGELQQKQGRQPQEREESQHIRGGRQERTRTDRRVHA